jgi:hypothetical protein
MPPRTPGEHPVSQVDPTPRCFPGRQSAEGAPRNRDQPTEPRKVPRTVSRSLISAFTAGRPHRHRPEAAQHDRPLWPSDSST